jgi:O-acetyl-ADP-ribose deacetylase (regulator of RNase III)
LLQRGKMDEWTINGKRLRIVEGNIVHLNVDAVVNAANKSLILGGGVAGAIRNHGGPSIQEECNEIGLIEVGEAVITGAGQLRAKYIIHAVGPVYGEGDEDKKLAKATLNSLKVAKRKKIRSIAFPAISTGIFHFPIKRCSEVMIKVAMDFLKENEFPQEIILCLYGERAYSIFQRTFERMTARSANSRA